MTASIQIIRACRSSSLVLSWLSTVAFGIIGRCIVFRLCLYDYATSDVGYRSGTVLGCVCFGYSDFVFDCHLFLAQLGDDAEATHFEECKDAIFEYEFSSLWIDYLQYFLEELSMLRVLVVVQVKDCGKE